MQAKQFPQDLIKNSFRPKKLHEEHMIFSLKLLNIFIFGGQVKKENLILIEKLHFHEISSQ